MDNKSEAKRLAKNTGLIAIGNFGAKLISFLLLPLYTSILSVSEYGLYDFIVTLSFFISPVVSLTIYESLFRFLITAKEKNDDEKIKGIICSSFYINLISILIYIIISIIIFIIFKIQYIPIFTIFIIAGIVYTFFISILRGIEQIKFYAIYSSIKNILQVVLSCLAITVMKLGINGLLYATIISSFSICFIIFLHFKLWNYLSFKKKYLKNIKSLLKYSIPLIPDTVSSSIVTLSDRVVVKQFINVEANGIYSIAHKFPSILEVIYHFFITAWNESASRVYEKDKENIKDYYQGLYDFIKRIVIGGVLCLIAFMPLLFRIFIRGDYIKAFEYVPFLLIAQMLNCIASFYSGILIANKDTKKIAKSTIIAALFNIVLNIVFVFVWGIYGVLIATVISNLILVMLRKINSDHYVKLDEDKKYYISALITFVFIIYLYSYNSFIKIISTMIISLLFFFITNKDFILVIINFFKKKMKGRKKNA